MELLTSLSVGFNQAEVPTCILEDASGDVYLNTHQGCLDVESPTGLKELYRRTASDTAITPLSIGF